MNKLTILLIVFFSSMVTAQQSEAEQWRTAESENLAYMYIDSGLVVIELAPFMAPNHVSQFKQLVAEQFYHGLDFYRVIDGFVAQGGDESETKESKNKGPLVAEFTRKAPPNSNFKLIQNNDFLAPQTGYLNGFSAGKDPKTNEEWLLHCPGTVALARNNEANSATTDFYIVIGQAPRHLDRNMSIFGRVLYGMDKVQKLQRADMSNPSGVIEDPAKRSKITSILMEKDVPLEQRIKLQVQVASSNTVKQRLKNARSMSNDFYHFKGNGKLDLCYHQLKTRVAP